MYVVSTFICLVVSLVQIYAHSTKPLNCSVAVVTGGANGIGYAIVDNYLKNGAQTVIIVDKNRTAGLKAENVLNSVYGAKRTVFIHGDVTKDLDRVTKIIFTTFKYVDILVNNAGILKESDPELTIKTNVLAPVLWSQRFFNCMRKDKGGKGGTIMNLASISAYTREPFFYFYKASKFAMLGFSVGMGHEYNFLSTRVRIFAICPGATRTDLTRQIEHSMTGHRNIFDKISKVTAWQLPDDVGKAAALLYTTARTGVAYTIEGGAPPVVAPDSVNVTAEYLLSL